MWIEKFRSIGVEINAVEEWLDYEKGHQNLLLGVYLGKAADESQAISKRTTDGLRHLKTEGYWIGSFAPFGYDKIEIGLHKSLKQNKDAQIVKDTFERVAAGESLQDLWKKHNKPTSRSNWYRMIGKLVYSGFYKVDGELVKARHEGIVSLETFMKVQKIKKRVIAGSRYYLKGLLISPNGFICSASGSRSKTRKKYHYYHDKTWRIREDEAHKIIANVLSSFQLSEDAQEMLKARIEVRKKKDNKLLKANLKNAEGSLSDMTDKFNNLKQIFLAKEITVQEYRELSSDLKQKILINEDNVKELKRKIKIRKTTTNRMVKVISNVYSVFRKSDAANKAKILKCIFPYGFRIEHGLFRTQYINKLLLESFDFQQIKQYLESSNETLLLTSPVRGGRRDLDRTLLLDLQAIILAA